MSFIRGIVLLLLVPAFLFGAPAFAQLAPMNEAGVTMGHVHLLVPDPEMHKKLWIDLFGAKLAAYGKLEALKLPGIILLINKGQGANLSGEPTADHFALAVQDLDAAKKRLSSANIKMSEGSAIALLPDGVRVELVENKKLPVPFAFDHFHIFASDVDTIRNWYVRNFGGVKFPDAAAFPGGELRFTAQSSPARVPTKGYPLDHISFEVTNLPEFCKKLESQGVKLDMNIIDAPAIGLRVTFVTDPIGTRIELTEGLAGK